MKKKIFFAFCFLALQITSCSIETGTIEVITEPGTTKFSIINNSGAQLENVKWNGIYFGNINPGEISGTEVPPQSAGQGYVFFYLKDKDYQSQQMQVVEKYVNDTLNIHKYFPIVAIGGSKLLTIEEVLREDDEE